MLPNFCPPPLYLFLSIYLSIISLSKCHRPLSRHSSFFILASSIRFKVFARNLIFRRRRELQPEQPLHHRGDSGKLPKREHGLDVRLQHDAELKQIGLSFHIFIVLTILLQAERQCDQMVIF